MLTMAGRKTALKQSSRKKIHHYQKRRGGFWASAIAILILNLHEHFIPRADSKRRPVFRIGLPSVRACSLSVQVVRPVASLRQ